MLKTCLFETGFFYDKIKIWCLERLFYQIEELKCK